ncbi:MAG: hypothetical protein IT429_13360 [Gemmataceae bacterium]|nr:hypothetical protein [Gemmataceae bacterium]
MQGAGWIPLLRKLPPALHEGLVLITTNSSEIIVQTIVRAERDYLVVRGRTSGSTDAGRVIIVPFDQINYASLTRRVLEAELQAILNTPGGPAPASASAEPVQVAAPAADDFEPFIPPPPPHQASPADQAPAEAVPEVSGSPTRGQPRPVAPSKSVLLARLRARLNADPGQASEG